MIYFFQEHNYAASGLTETSMSGVQFGDSGMPPEVKVVKLSVTTRAMAKVSWNLFIVYFKRYIQKHSKQNNRRNSL